MTAHRLVVQFYDRIWNKGDLEAASELLSEEVAFRGSLGVHAHGVEGFLDYVETVRGALSGYHCEILSALTEGELCFARVNCSGTHVGQLLGVPATGRRVTWDIAALFTIADGRLADIWVMGDLASLERQLRG